MRKISKHGMVPNRKKPMEQDGTIVYLVRHGKSELNQQRRVSGQLDTILSSKGAEQSLQLSQVLKNEPLSAIYTSTLTRTVETARPTAEYLGIPIQQREALREIHHGIVQGRFHDERDPEAHRLWVEREKDKRYYRIPEGETFPELVDRVTPCLIDILKGSRGKTILIVGHRSTNRVLLGTLMQWPRESWCDLNLRGKYLYRIQNGSDPQLVTISLDKETTGIQFDGLKV